MIRYANIVNNETGLCEVGLGTNAGFYQSIGMTQLDVQQSDIDNNWYLTEKCPMKTDEQKAQARQEQFNNAFFNTSLGYIRREVSMLNGTTKTFLTDMLPQLVIGFPILAYNEPDFTQDVNMVDYQKQVVVTEQFLAECKNQLIIDFYGFNPMTINTDSETPSDEAEGGVA